MRPLASVRPEDTLLAAGWPWAALALAAAVGCAASSGPPGTTSSSSQSSSSSGGSATTSSSSGSSSASTTSTVASSSGSSVASTGSTSASSSGSSSGAASSSSGASSGGALTGAPDDTWTWFDFPTALCASGTPTGLAINPHAGATDLLIYFEGGGFCSDSVGCWGPDPTATNLGGYDAGTFFSKDNGQLRYLALERDAGSSPFTGMDFVFIPYCTGDLHSGNTVTNMTLADGGIMPTYFYGGRDMEIFLERLVPTFPSVTRVWLLGTSAGGFGTIFDFNLVATAFGIGVDIIDDSGPPLVANGRTDNVGMFTGWASVLPDAGFTTLAQLLDYDLQVQTTFSPPGQFGFLSFEEDSTIGPDFGYDAGTQYPGLMQQFSATLPPAPTAATFLVTDDLHHVVESDASLAPQYMSWMTQMVNRNAAWADEVADGG